jgi:hypothetical protein
MKRSLATLALCLMLTACTPSSTQPQALAPGYSNSADQQMGEILAGAHSFYSSIQQQSASGQLTLTAAQKTAFNDFGVSLNAAQSVYLAYHAGTATQAAAQAAVNTVQTKQAALPTPAVSQ